MPGTSAQERPSEMDVDGMSGCDITQSLLSRFALRKRDPTTRWPRQGARRKVRALKSSWGTPAPQDAKCIEAIQGAHKS